MVFKPFTLSRLDRPQDVRELDDLLENITQPGGITQDNADFAAEIYEYSPITVTATQVYNCYELIWKGQLDSNGERIITFPISGTLESVNAHQYGSTIDSFIGFKNKVNESNFNTGLVIKAIKHDGTNPGAINVFFRAIIEKL